jgi:DNA (cytosine-5)-methyltransferase 1
VPGLLSAIPGDIPVTQRIYQAFEEIGYEIRNPKLLKKALYSASDFGVPQKRNRVIIIGVNKHAKIDLEELYNKLDELTKKTKPSNVYDAIGHLPKFKPLQKLKKINGKNISHEQLNKTNVKFHDARFHNTRDIEIFKKWLKDDMNRRTSQEKISFYNNLMGKNSNHAKYRNLEWYKPSPTIVAHLYKDGLMFIHPDSDQARSITVKEAALLQSFPDDFEFIGSQGYAFKMIGNAVPPKMAKNIAIAIAEKLNV